MKLAFVLAFLTIAMSNTILACRTVEEVDDCAMEISFLKNLNRKVPQNDKEAVAMCGNYKRGLECLRDHFTNCLTGLHQSWQTFGKMLLDNLEPHLNGRCDSEAHRADFMQHVSCFTNETTADAVRLCADKYMVMSELAITKPKELHLPTFCCANHLMIECIHGHLRSSCTGQTGDYFSDIIQEETEVNVVNLCKQFSDIATCDAKFVASTWAELKEIHASTDVARAQNHKYKTIIGIMLKMTA